MAMQIIKKVQQPNRLPLRRDFQAAAMDVVTSSMSSLPNIAITVIFPPQTLSRIYGNSNVSKTFQGIEISIADLVCA